MIRLWAAVLLTGCSWTTHAFADRNEVEVIVKKIEFFETNFSSNGRRLTPLGAYTLQSTHDHFGAFSGLRISCEGELAAITDTGFWFNAQVKRDDGGKILKIENGRFQRVLNGAGKPTLSKWLSDFESLTFDNRFAYLGAEQRTRLLRFLLDGDFTTSNSEVVKGATPTVDTRENNGFEAIATLPNGSLFVVHERLRDRYASVPGFLLKEGKRTDFRVVRFDNYSITDADVAGDDLLLLERRISPVDGNQMRIRSIPVASLKAGALIEGKIIHQSIWPDPVDNMEGLSVCLTEKGYRLSIISDDNHWPLQRTLFLEFMLKR